MRKSKYLTPTKQQVFWLLQASLSFFKTHLQSQLIIYIKYTSLTSLPV